MAFGEVRALVPERAGHHVDFAIMIEIADISALRPELVGGGDLFKRVQALFGVKHGRGKREGDAETDGQDS